MPPDLSVTVTATVDPPLGSDLAKQVGAEVTAAGTPGSGPPTRTTPTAA